MASKACTFPSGGREGVADIALMMPGRTASMAFRDDFGTAVGHFDGGPASTAYDGPVIVAARRSAAAVVFSGLPLVRG